jgi:hypothetical protein
MLVVQAECHTGCQLINALKASHCNSRTPHVTYKADLRFAQALKGWENRFAKSNLVCVHIFVYFVYIFVYIYFAVHVVSKK